MHPGVSLAGLELLQGCVPRSLNRAFDRTGVKSGNERVVCMVFGFAPKIFATLARASNRRLSFETILQDIYLDNT